MENKTAKDLLPLIKGKNYMQINEIVLKWSNDRIDKNLDPVLKYASLSGILEANITILLDHINTIEKP